MNFRIHILKGSGHFSEGLRLDRKIYIELTPGGDFLKWTAEDENLNKNGENAKPHRHRTVVMREKEISRTPHLGFFPPELSLIEYKLMPFL